MLESILVSGLTLPAFLVCTAVSLVLGIATAFLGMYRSKCSQGFAVTVAVLPAIVQIVILLVNGNVGAGVAVAGAFSLVRFRSVPGTALAVNDSSAPAVTYADLADINGTALVPDGAGENTELTVADAVRALLLWTGMTEQQLGSFPDDYLAQARSMGMIDADTDADAPDEPEQ